MGTLAVLDHFPNKLFKYEALGSEAERFHRGGALTIHNSKSCLICWDIQSSKSMILLNRALGEEVARGGMFFCWLRSGCQSWPFCCYMESCHPLFSWPHSLLLCVCMHVCAHACMYSCLGSLFLAAAVGGLWMHFQKLPKAQLLLAWPTSSSFILCVEIPVWGVHH